MHMRYQLVLQFEANTMADFDQLVTLEDKLIEELGSVATIDGHDFGSGEFNIFVLTDDPPTTFSAAHRVVTSRGVQHVMRAAYRELAADDYVVLWPPSLTEFTVA
jgi:hypothetical protein